MTHSEFFATLRELSPLRIVSQCGPSVFEAIVPFDPYGIADGHLTAITECYHWHIDLTRFRHAVSYDTIHARSGRQVLYVALHESPAVDPFLVVYLYRGRDEEFDDRRRERFGALHARLAGGEAMIP